MQIEEARGRFLDTLFAAAVGATPWRPVLDTFAEIMDAPMGAINVWDPFNTRASHSESLNTPGTFQQRSQEYWITREPWARRGFELVATHPGFAEKGFVFHGAEQVPTRSLLESDWYRDFARELEMQDCLGLAAQTSEGHYISVTAITGSRSGRLFGNRALDLSALLRADFARALSLHTEISRQKARKEVSAQWDSTPLPVIVLRDGELLQANDAAWAALEAGDIVKALRGKRIAITDPELAALARAHLQATGPRSVSQIATGLSGARWLAQAVRFNQLSGSLLGTTGIDDPALMLALTPLDSAAGSRGSALHSFVSLTPTERDIAYGLLNGDSVASIARSNRKSVETVRWHVRNMIAKTGARNLADLTRILSLLLPL